jgi:hypothetical protein
MRIACLLSCLFCRTVVVTLAILSTAASPAPAADEPPPSVTASSILPASTVKGAHHRIEEPVKTETFFHEFSIASDFGAFEAIGRSMLAIRIQEIEALAALTEVSKTDVFLSAAGQSVVSIGKGAASAVTDPAGTVKGLGAGVKRFGVNLGRRGQRAVEGTDDKGGAQEGEKESAASSAGKSLIGVTAAARRWARKVNVDPYTTNPVLKQALEDIAKVDVAGSIATKVVVPVPAPVGMTANVGDLVWGQDPEEVRKINEGRAKELGVSDADATGLFRNSWMTLTYQTRLIAALHTVRAAGCADYVRTAAESRSDREALFFVESAEMLQRQHAAAAVAKVLPDSRAMVAATSAGVTSVLLPLDWVRSTSATDKVIRDIDARAKQELGASRVNLVLTGQLSEGARTLVSSLGWSVSEGASSSPRAQ